MIVFGSRMYFRKNKVASHGKCEHCGRYGKQRNYDGRKFGHLYFIPLVPEGGRVRVVGECAKCGHGAHIPIESAEKMRESLVETAMQDLDRLQSGEMTYSDAEGTHSTVASLAGAIGMIYRLAGPEDAETLVSEVREGGNNGASDVIQGALRQSQGRAEEALQHFQQAERDMPDSPQPPYLRGSLLANLGRPAEACEALERASDLAPDDLGIKLERIDAYTNAKQPGRAVDLFEEVFAAAPGLAGDKQMVKLYRKACKKAGRPTAALA